MRDNPTLSPEQIDRIRSSAQRRSVRKGEVLYESSQPDVPLFVVLEVACQSAGTGRMTKS
jgi:thioredoxin reductase (NADPH)